VSLRPVWKEARRILCVRLDSMGDVLMTTPAIAALRAAGPRITLLTSSAGALVAGLVPDIDDVIRYDAPWMKATPPRRDAAADSALIQRLTERRFDAAVIFTVYSQDPLPAALTCFLAGIPLRLAHCRENPYQLLTDWVPDPEPTREIRHEVRRQLDLVASAGFAVQGEHLRLCVPLPARSRVQRLLRSADLPSRWVLVHPGSTAASRRYPPEHFAAAAAALSLRCGHDIVFSGSEADVPLVEDIRERMRCPSRSFAGKLDVAELAALIEATPLFIGNNSGPAHIAAAVGTPLVDLYALTNPQHTPWSAASRVLYQDVPCKYCYRSVCPEGHHACLRGVTPERVVEAAMELLEGRAAPR
jgi:lipopolysaccharide heptosyltransferase II